MKENGPRGQRLCAQASLSRVPWFWS